jgi:hypothetical protein
MSEPGWKVFGNATLAHLLEPEEVRLWVRNDFTVGPGEAAIVAKNGALQDILTEERRNLGGWSDRHLPTIKKWLGLKSEYRVLMLSTSPFDIPVAVSSVSLDHQRILGEGVMRCSVVLENAAGLLGLLNGRSSIVIKDIAERLQPELAARVFDPAITRACCDEIRGNPDFTQQVEATARAEVQRALSAWGIRLDSLTVAWALTDQDRANMERKAQQMRDDDAEFAHTRALREMERKAQLLQQAKEYAQEDCKRAEAGTIELEHLKLDAALSAEDKRNAQRFRVAELNAEIAQLDTDVKLAALALDRERDRIDLDRRKEELNLLQGQQAFKDAQIRLEFETVQQAKRERMRMEQEHALNAMRLQQEGVRLQLDAHLQQLAVQAGMIERVMSQGLASGAVDSEAIRTMLEEQTRMRAADRGDTVATAMFAAEAAKHSVEALKHTEDRERQHQYQTTRLSSDMMQAAKQQVPGAVPSATGASEPAPPASVNILKVEVPGYGQAGGIGGTCTQCGGSLKQEWIACPFCGKKAKTD